MVRIAFIHKSDNYFFSEDHMDQTYNNFFKRALPEHADVKIVSSMHSVDVNFLDVDAIVLWD